MEINSFFKRFNESVEILNDTIANYMMAIEGPFDPHYEYRATEIAIDSDGQIVVGGRATGLTVSSVQSIDHQIETVCGPGGDIWNYSGSYIEIDFLDGDYLKLIHEYNDEGYADGSVDLFDPHKSFKSYPDGMDVDIFWSEYYEVVDAFNDRSSDYCFADSEDEDDEKVWHEIRLDDDGYLVVLDKKTKISVNDIKSISYRVHSQEDESCIRFALVDGKNFIVHVGGNPDIVAYMPDEEFYAEESENETTVSDDLVNCNDTIDELLMKVEVEKAEESSVDMNAVRNKKLLDGGEISIDDLDPDEIEAVNKLIRLEITQLAKDNHKLEEENRRLRALIEEE